MPTAETARAERFAAYVDQLAAVLGHRDRHEPLRAYITGLCLPGERKSIEPMAARVDPRQMSLFGAGWTVGTLKALAKPGVHSITYFETTGRQRPLTASEGGRSSGVLRSSRARLVTNVGRLGGRV